MKVKKIFGELNMTWLAVILFATACGVYTGLIMLVPFLKETSFQDIGISYEWWVVFAVAVTSNCKKNWEAMLKCFVFFLISQPLVYLTEILLGSMTFAAAAGYYKFWFKLTLLCLPGGFVAFYAKKQNLFGSIVLGLGNTVELFMSMVHFTQMSRDFPHHILTALVSLGAIALLTLSLQKERKYRILSGIVIPLGICGILLLFLKISGLVLI